MLPDPDVETVDVFDALVVRVTLGDFELLAVADELRLPDRDGRELIDIRAVPDPEPVEDGNRVPVGLADSEVDRRILPLTVGDPD